MLTRSTVVGVVLLILVAGCRSGPPLGSPAPDFAATDTDGRRVSLATYADTVLILDFWAVW